MVVHSKVCVSIAFVALKKTYHRPLFSIITDNSRYLDFDYLE